MQTNDIEIQVETVAKRPIEAHLTAEKQQALHLLKTTNISRAKIARDLGLNYAHLTKLQKDLSIERPEQVFGLPKHEVPVRQRKERKPRKRRVSQS